MEKTSKRMEKQKRVFMFRILGELLRVQGSKFKGVTALVSINSYI